MCPPLVTSTATLNRVNYSLLAFWRRLICYCFTLFSSVNKDTKGIKELEYEHYFENLGEKYAISLFQYRVVVNGIWRIFGNYFIFWTDLIFVLWFFGLVVCLVLFLIVYKPCDSERGNNTWLNNFADDIALIPLLRIHKVLQNNSFYVSQLWLFLTTSPLYIRLLSEQKQNHKFGALFITVDLLCWANWPTSTSFSVLQ